ncbi:MAG: hypothetical protein KF842_07755 [Caulobacter sp.]|nr:hypothetical protein [Caulobacter sp.]
MTYHTGDATRPQSHQTQPRQTSSEEPRGGNTAMWVVAGLVAVVAIIAVAFMVASANNAQSVSQDDLDRVAEQSRLQGMVEGAQSTYNAATTQAQVAANQAAADARAAAQDTRDAAEQARISSQQALDRAAEPAPAPSEPPPPPQ